MLLALAVRPAQAPVHEPLRAPGAVPAMSA